MRYTGAMTKQSTQKAKTKPANKVPYEPNKMALAVSAAAATILVLFAAIAVYL